MKLTKTNFKTFIKKNDGQLLIERRNRFDGMTDGLEGCERGFSPVLKSDRHVDYTFGIEGAWLVGGGRDYFQAFENDQFKGIEVYNACGNFVVAVLK